MTVQLEARTPEAVLARIDEIIQELQELHFVVNGMWQNGEAVSSLNTTTAALKNVSVVGARTEDIVEQLWGSLGQETLADVQTAYQQDIYLEIFNDESPH